METATDEPTSDATQQELSGSNTGHLTVSYDSEDANYCARVDELVRGIESMPFVRKISQIKGGRLGGLLCRWTTTIISGHCESERVWMTGPERGSKR